MADAVLLDKVSSILIVEVAGIGDAVMVVPALRAIRLKHPQAKITLLVSPRAYPLLSSCPYIDEVITFDIGHFKRWYRLLNIFKTISLIFAVFKLRREKFDIAVNLYRLVSLGGRVKMRLLFELIHPVLSVGRNRTGAAKVFALEHKEDLSAEKHQVEVMLAVAALLGAESQDKRLELWPQTDDERSVSELFKKEGITSRDFAVGINPNAYQPANLWFEERFAQVADFLIENHQVKIIFFGSARDCGRVEAICSLMKHKAVNFCGRLSLREYVSCIKRLRLFISLDSGPMHIASVFKIPTVALFGGENAAHFRPYGNEKAVVVQKPVGCNPCQKKLECKKRLCMQAISADDIIRACLSLLPAS